MMRGVPREGWSLDPGITLLNHGSYGACPIAVLEEQQRLRAQMERHPDRFFARDLEPLLDAARCALAAFVGADANDLAFVPNATNAVNAVLRSLDLQSGDEILITDHTYNACANAVRYVAERADARVAIASVPFPLSSSEEILEALLASVTPHTRLALVDHVTSPTALVLPIARIVAELATRGVDTLVDGAHAPGMIALDLDAIGAAYYTGNCHKWLCAPKGAAFLHVRSDRQRSVRPLAISHGANSPRGDRSRFRIEFDWTGTDDPTPYLCIPESIRWLGERLPGGWPALMDHNRSLALEGRRLVADGLAIDLPCPDDLIGSMASLPLPDGLFAQPSSTSDRDPLQQQLLADYAIDLPVFPWPAPPKRLLRISAQLYNRIEDYRLLVEALATARKSQVAR